MKKFASIMIGASLAALQGCSSAQPSKEADSQSAELNAGTSSLTITSSTATSYCAKVTMSNGLSQATNVWRMVLDLKTSTKTSVSGATFSANTGKVTVKPASAASIAPGATASFTFCANAPSTVRPAIFAWNMEMVAAMTTCATNSGLQPTKAALAIAMAKELGRWQPQTDLVLVQRAPYYYRVELSTTGAARCASGCPNVKGLLGQQDAGIINFVDQLVFNPEMFRTDLEASFNRQYNKIDDLTRNNRSALPPAHKLTLRGGPTNLGIGSCGPHYIFQADKLDGTPLSTAQAQALGNALCFYGYGDCGQNPYISFTTTTVNCPTGKTCVALDPTDGDNGSISTTSAGSAPTYPQNRAWDPTNTLLNTTCVKVNGTAGMMLSKCDTNPNSCGFLYCI